MTREVYKQLELDLHLRDTDNIATRRRNQRTGYENWVLGMLNDPTITKESVAETVARVILARDAMIAILGDRAQAGDAHYRESRTDPLTELPNRRLFNETFDRFVRSGKPFTLMHIDVDHFGDFNTNHGHEGGDQVLVQTGLRLVENIRQTEFSRPGTSFLQRRTSPTEFDLAARLGGDEFAVLLSGVTDSETLALRAEEIRAAIADKPFLLGANRTPSRVTVSIGCGIFREGMDPQKFLSGVDRYALYEAKKTRNAVAIHRN